MNREIQFVENDKKVYNAKDISRLLGIGMNKAYELLNSESFPTIKIGKRKVVSTKAFEVWLDKESWK